MMTAMIEVEKLTNEAGQAYTVFTADQQLYRVILDMFWTNPQRFSNFIPRIGGIHWLMSFVGSVGFLMENSGLQKMMKSVFAGMEKMLTGKKFSMNVRALRFVVVELLHGFIDDMVCCEDLDQFLKEVASKSVLAKHWVNNLIKPVFLMLYICAEQEGEFASHLYACKQMMPYFFAAGHINYAQYGLCYIKTMEKLPIAVLHLFLCAEHVVHHQEGIWNAM